MGTDPHLCSGDSFAVMQGSVDAGRRMKVVGDFQMGWGRGKNVWCCFM